LPRIQKSLALRHKPRTDHWKEDTRSYALLNKGEEIKIREVEGWLLSEKKDILMRQALKDCKTISNV